MPNQIERGSLIRAVTDEVDLRSDTVTRPSAGMREAIARAQVGDDVLGDDPTTNALQDRVAELLGKPAALFFPSGTQANQTALALLGRPGTELVLEARAHIVDYEDSAAAVLNGLQLRPVETSHGLLTADAVEGAIRPEGRFLPRTSIVALENTHLDSGGRVLPLQEVEAVGVVTSRLGVGLHLDGARLWNAAVASSELIRAFAAPVDTVMVSVSKGLGAPIGSVLACSEAHIDEARRIRRRLGGGMRQVGLLAAAAIYALENHLGRIEDDHVRARTLFEGVGRIDGLSADEPETNVLFIHIDPTLGTAADVICETKAQGVRFSHFGHQRMRAVTHLDVDDTGIARALSSLAEAVDRLG
jgi:threonine aldolase